MEEFLSPSEVAKALGVCHETVMLWIRKGELRAANVSRNRGSMKPRFRIRPSDLDLFLASRQPPPPPPPRRPRRPNIEIREIIK
ncbi:MAG: hypothetical protein CL946_03930 [Ectothiorhodospiraceae bacterium]|nr:hypothetical protein [Ectothiorhodospiraceae bacterium]